MIVRVPELPREIRDLLADLRLEDEQTNGRPTLRPEQAARAREWLALVLLDGQRLCRHAQLLQTFYPGRFEPPLSRRFRPEGASHPGEPASTSPFRHHQ